MTENSANHPRGQSEPSQAEAPSHYGLPQAAGVVPMPSVEEVTSLSRNQVILLGLGFAPLLVAFFLNLWAKPHYQFFPLALAGVGFLAWTRLKAAARPFVPGDPILILLLMGLSCLVLTVATVLWSPWLGSLAALFCCFGLAWWVGGWRLFRCLLPAFLLVLTTIPPPLGWDTRLTMHLRGLAVRWSSRMLDTLGVIHALSGNIIELPRQKLLVEEACSGINSVLFTAAAALFYTLWRRRSLPRILITVGSTLAVVLMGNVLRITLGAWLRYSHGVDILSGWRHETVGLALFSLYLLLIVSMDRWLSFLTSPVPTSSELVPQAETVAAPVPAPVGLVQAPVQLASYWAWVAAGVFAGLGLAQLGRGWLDYQQEKAKRVIPVSALRAGAAFTMPEKAGDWQRLNSEAPALHKIETAGVFSQVWHYRRGETVASLALDYPFRGYHDVTWCYENAGWKVAQRTLIGGGSLSNSPAWTEVRMEKDLITRAGLWIATVDEQGRWQEKSLAERSYLERWNISGRSEPTTYRVQLLVTGYTPLPPAEWEAARRLFEEGRQLLAQQLFAQMHHQP
ncbi:MAG: exosortase U [Verrucomicrobia bacterium]|nr:exosortase U [Verrucomicrobiota bacterium]